MRNEDIILLVPWDFTNISEYALQHAFNIARNTQKKIEILHVVSSNVTLKQRQKIEDELRNTVNTKYKNQNISTTIKILKGNIYNTISDYAEQISANLVVMGTHGIKGFEMITGSKAYKVLLGSKVPFLLVKTRPQEEKKYTDIVLPIDFKVENMEKYESAVYFGQYFDSKIHIFRPPVHNNDLNKKTNVNINVAKKLLNQSNIKYDIKTASKPNRFTRETIRYAETIDADIILIITTKHKLKDVIFGEHEQNIIDNEANIPVLCVNPSPELSSKDF